MDQLMQYINIIFNYRQHFKAFYFNFSFNYDFMCCYNDFYKTITMNKLSCCCSFLFQIISEVSISKTISLSFTFVENGSKIPD